MAAHVPGIVVLALGAGALGGVDALRFLLGFAGQSPLVDIAVCIFVVGMVTAQLLGVVLLVRFVRRAPKPARAISHRDAPEQEQAAEPAVAHRARRGALEREQAEAVARRARTPSPR